MSTRIIDSVLSIIIRGHGANLRYEHAGILLDENAPEVERDIECGGFIVIVLIGEDEGVTLSAWHMGDGQRQVWQGNNPCHLVLPEGEYDVTIVTSAGQIAPIRIKVRPKTDA